MGRLARDPKEPEQLIGAAPFCRGKPVSCKDGPKREKEWDIFTLALTSLKTAWMHKLLTILNSIIKHRVPWTPVTC